MSPSNLSRRRLCAVLFVTCVAVLLGACGLTVRQRTAVQKFSAATIDFTTLTSSELIKSRTDVLEMNRLRVQLNDDTVKLGRLDEHFTVERVKVRVDAVAALKEYAELLHTLVTSSQKDQLKTASDAFVTSLRKVQGLNLGDEQAGSIGAAVQRIGGLVVEYMRARAARQVVTTAHPAVLQLLDLVRRDFSPTADHWSLGYEKVISALTGAAALAARDSAAPAKSALIGEAQVVAEGNRTRFKSVAAQVNNSVAALREAQMNLRYALQSADVTIEDIDGYAAQIEDFVKTYRILRDR